MTDKLALAEEILFRYRLKSSGMTEKDMIEAIQAYHEAKKRESKITESLTAKEFYENQLHDKTTVVGRLEKDEIIELMQAYHEAKLKEVTDADIEHKADDVANRESSKEFERGEWLGFKEGARAFRDGLIKRELPLA